MESEKLVIAAWPTLLTEADAAKDLSIDLGVFRAVARHHSVLPVDFGTGAKRWRKNDLGKLIRKPDYDKGYWASASSQPLVKLDRQSIEAVAEAIGDQMEPLYNSNNLGALVSINDAVSLLGVGRSTVYRLIETGELTKRKIRRRTLVTKTSLEQLLKVDPKIG